ncbi:hypothetical protein CBR_g952 [Chara braunii]|uniref:Uncharacterized protein n=1 Tax=Chara braunii TaxID=69332 RepID=A0A388KCS4_CHABU|nr:hypothetical protein CBR_g952 [Chara braunii]|eukprot:GBG67831.1 hypothetical protein CBR_g952 [Chara braunii]
MGRRGRSGSRRFWATDVLLGQVLLLLLSITAVLSLKLEREQAQQPSLRTTGVDVAGTIREEDSEGGGEVGAATGTRARASWGGRGEIEPLMTTPWQRNRPGGRKNRGDGDMGTTTKRRTTPDGQLQSGRPDQGKGATAKTRQQLLKALVRRTGTRAMNVEATDAAERQSLLLAMVGRISTISRDIIAACNESSLEIRATSLTRSEEGSSFLLVLLLVCTRDDSALAYPLRGASDPASVGEEDEDVRRTINELSSTSRILEDERGVGGAGVVDDDHKSGGDADAVRAWDNIPHTEESNDRRLQSPILVSASAYRGEMSITADMDTQNIPIQRVSPPPSPKASTTRSSAATAATSAATSSTTRTTTTTNSTSSTTRTITTTNTTTATTSSANTRSDSGATSPLFSALVLLTRKSRRGNRAETGVDPDEWVSSPPLPLDRHLSDPTAIAISANGTVAYVADARTRSILAVSLSPSAERTRPFGAPATTVWCVASSPDLDGPADVAVDGKREILYATTRRGLVAVDLLTGQAEVTMRACASGCALCAPLGSLALSSSGRWGWVVDSSRDVVVRFGLFASSNRKGTERVESGSEKKRERAMSERGSGPEKERGGDGARNPAAAAIAKEEGAQKKIESGARALVALSDDDQVLATWNEAGSRRVLSLYSVIANQAKGEEEEEEEEHGHLFSVSGTASSSSSRTSSSSSSYPTSSAGFSSVMTNIGHGYTEGSGKGSNEVESRSTGATKVQQLSLLGTWDEGECINSTNVSASVRGGGWEEEVLCNGRVVAVSVDSRATTRVVIATQRGELIEVTAAPLRGNGPAAPSELLSVLKKHDPDEGKINRVFDRLETKSKEGGEEREEEEEKEEEGKGDLEGNDREETALPCGSFFSTKNGVVDATHPSQSLLLLRLPCKVTNVTLLGGSFDVGVIHMIGFCAVVSALLMTALIWCLCRASAGCTGWWYSSSHGLSSGPWQGRQKETAGMRAEDDAQPGGDGPRTLYGRQVHSGSVLPRGRESRGRGGWDRGPSLRGAEAAEEEEEGVVFKGWKIPPGTLKRSKEDGKWTLMWPNSVRIG